MLIRKLLKPWSARQIILIGLAVGIGLSASGKAEDAPAAATSKTIDFERHIAPLFGRLGCNSAACHGAFGGGRGGLQFSLFGYSAKMDFLAVEDRIDRSEPDSSLLLLKPAGQIEHEGGVRFQPGSKADTAIRQWIEGGATWVPGSGRVKALSVEPPRVVFEHDQEGQRLVVIAEFFDGSREDVTHLCRLTSRDEGIATIESGNQVMRSRQGDTSVTVAYGNAFTSVGVLAPADRSAKSDPSAGDSEAGFIDARINEKLTLLKIVPSDRSSDEEFLRRVMLDTIGAIPTPDEVTQFCADTAEDKREVLIDELLSHPMHSALWATRMCDITRCDAGAMGEDQILGVRRAQMWHDWFRRRFEENTPYDRIVRGVVTATSREGQSVGDWMAEEEQLIHRSRDSFDNNYADRASLDLYWRRTGADSEAILKSNAELTAVAFTGVRLNCAQCHKHPFDRWTQDDYAAFANIFAGTIYGSSTETNSAVLEELARRREAKKADRTVRSLPRIREVFVSRELARGLNGSEPGADVSPRAFDSRDFDPNADFRQQFYEWLVAPENPYFARSFVNRIWATCFGTGLVDPVDDFSVTNPPSHPKLLDELAEAFRDSGFDIRSLEKQILMSSAYQRTSTPNASNRDDHRNFSRQQIRPLLAEVALDALNKALGTNEDFGESARNDSLAIEVGTNQLQGDAGRALELFGRGRREATCDCDRRTESDLRQFIFLINDQSVIDKIRHGSVRQLLALDDRQLVQQLYLRVLGRQPKEAEAQVGVSHLSGSEDRDAAFDDLVWALINTREFITNH